MTLAPQPQTGTQTCTCRVNGGIVSPCPELRRVMELLEAADECGDDQAFNRLTRAYAAHLRAVNEGAG